MCWPQPTGILLRFHTVPIRMGLRSRARRYTMLRDHLTSTILYLVEPSRMGPSSHQRTRRSRQDRSRSIRHCSHMVAIDTDLHGHSANTSPLIRFTLTCDNGICTETTSVSRVRAVTHKVRRRRHASATVAARVARQAEVYVEERARDSSIGRRTTHLVSRIGVPCIRQDMSRCFHSICLR